MAGRDGEVGEKRGRQREHVRGKKIEKTEVGHIDPISAVAVINTSHLNLCAGEWSSL